MTVNDLPSWVPVFNLVASVTALALAVLGLRFVGWIVAYRAALALALVVLLAGALFQANILPLWAWVVFGSGGRLVLLALIVTGTVAAWPDRRSSTSLDDIAAQLRDIQRLALMSSDSAERAHVAASAADDRVISQSERAVDDRARTSRIEVAIAENTELTQLAADAADHAYTEANGLNEKIASQGAVIVKQGEDAAEDRERGVRIEDVATDTRQRTIDIQERLP